MAIENLQFEMVTNVSVPSVGKSFNFKWIKSHNYSGTTAGTILGTIFNLASKRKIFDEKKLPLHLQQW